jgi:hypothetical protein
MKSNNAKSTLAHLNNIFDMKKTLLCRDAMVEITKVNIEPNWGLYNGAIGTVVYILLGRGNPNERHLPTVVVVDLKQYRGSIWDEDNPCPMHLVTVK